MSLNKKNEKYFSVVNKVKRFIYENKVLNLFVLGFLLVGLILPAVSAANLAPVIGAVSDKEVKVGETLEFNIAVKDPEGDQIVSLLNAGKSPEGVAITKVTNNQYKFSWTPIAGQEGNHQFGLRATDAQGASSATEYFTVVVAAADVPAPANQAPIVSPIKDKTVTVGESLEFTIMVKDPEGDEIVTLANAGKTPEGVSLAKTGVNAFKFSWTPVAGQEGNHQFGLRATDAQGASSATEYFKVSVAASDVPPPVPPTCESVTVTDKDTLTLQEGEEKCYTFNSVAYKIQLTFVDEDEAKFKVNGADTAKLKINAEETFADGKTKITVKDILYQAYAGGMHAATFTLTAVVSLPPIADKDKDGIADGLDNCPDAANPDQKDTDGDKLGDVCDNGTTTPPPADTTNTAKTEYNTLKDKYDSYEDDFSYYHKKYDKAVKEEDKSDLKKYEKKLKELDDNLDDVEDDVQDLIDDLEDDKDKNENVLDDLDELQDDITALKENISDALNGKSEDAADYSAADYVPSTVAPAKEEAVEVTTYSDLVGVTGAAAVEPEVKEINWSQVRYTALLIAGIVVLLAVVLFLLAMLFR